MHKLLIGKPNSPNGELKKSTGIVAKLRWFDEKTLNSISTTSRSSVGTSQSSLRSKV